eukprot:TRINITY_DN67098_c4_g3_i1.p1 TRINITY_DN67098_c4_g3~~TRINITY_DN67098_c4_g3_i1.p1  ORF type:complete len:526 (-),score=27.11 TRINITY_DN67098_c4_g3_i1:586-2142(-)
MDANRKLSVSEVQDCWNSNRTEYNYWVPTADVKGTIPPELHGTFFRNGPGITDKEGKKFAHPIDGDGLVGAVTFVDGRVHFAARFVKTFSHVEEERYPGGKVIYRGQMGVNPESLWTGVRKTAWSMVTGSTPNFVFRDPSNTNAFYWGGKLISCYEVQPPNVLDPHTLDTLGRENFDGKLRPKQPLLAHFRLDFSSHTPKLVVCSHKASYKGTSKVTFLEFDEQWKCHRERTFKVPELTYCHDFLLTDNYYIVHISPFVKINTATMLKVASGWATFGQCMRHYPDLPSQIVVLPRTGNQDDIKKLDVPPCHIYHYGNVQEKGSHILFNALCLPPGFNMNFDGKMWLANGSEAPGHMFEFDVNLAENKCTRTEKPSDPSCGEFPTVHPYRHGKECRYAYCMMSDRPGEPLPTRDVVKYDTQGTNRQVWKSHGVIGEPTFIPRGGYQSAKSGDEDDGWVIVQVNIPETKTVDYCVLDAKDITKGPVCTVQLKHHVPIGFHGTFTPHTFISPPSIGPTPKL